MSKTKAKDEIDANSDIKERRVNDKSHSLQAKASDDLYASLPRLEIFFYGAFLVWSYSTIIYRFCQLSKSKERELLQYNYIEEGWWFNRGQDSDFEWNYWKSLMSPFFVGSIIAYIGFTRAVEFLVPKHRETFLPIGCLTFLFTFYNWRVVAYLIVQTFVTYIVSRTRRRSLIWVTAVGQMAILNMDSLEGYLKDLIASDNIDDLVFLTALCILKFISFSLECCDETNIPSCTKTGRKQDSFLDLFVYTFYLPLFLIGPILVYSKFRQQMNQPVNPWDKQKYIQCFWEALHYFGWMLGVEVFLHYSYHPSLSFDTITLKHATYVETAGYVMCSLLYFQMKYMALYGFPRLLCLLDGLDSPKPPMCIHAMYSFKDMWRFFDRGLHVFLVRHVYIPMGGSKAGVLRQQLASICCFAMVYYWHGGSTHVLYWAILNWFGLTIETIGETLIKLKLSHKMPSWVSSAMQRRLVAVLRGVMYLMLAPSNIFFLAGVKVGLMVTKKTIFTSNLFHTFLSFFFYYCIVQVLLEVYHKWGKKNICNKTYYYIGGRQENKQKAN